MLCPKCKKYFCRFSILKNGYDHWYVCRNCNIEYKLKAEIAEDIENFVYTSIERVMATRIDYMPMPRGTGLPIYI